MICLFDSEPQDSRFYQLFSDIWLMASLIGSLRFIYSATKFNFFLPNYLLCVAIALGISHIYIIWDIIIGVQFTNDDQWHPGALADVSTILAAS